MTAAGTADRMLKETVLDGSLLLAVPIAVLAGLVSFVSPCVLPLVPGYLGYVTGLTGVDLEQQRRGRMLLGAALFVAGFTVVYVAIGWLDRGALGAALTEHADVAHSGARRAHDRARPGLPRAAAAAAGSRRIDVRPAAGLLGAPLLGCRLRSRLDALHRSYPRRDRSACPALR